MSISDRMNLILRQIDDGYGLDVTSRMHTILSEAEATGPMWTPDTPYEKGMRLPPGWGLAFGKTPYRRDSRIKVKDFLGDKEVRKSIDAIRKVHRQGVRLAGDTRQQIEVATSFLQKHEDRRPALHQEIQSLAPSAKVTSRIKSLASALGKVARKPREYADVSRIGDGTGIRVIAEDIREVESIVDKIRENYEIVPPDADYLDEPLMGERGLGYRSYHLVIRDKDGLEKEIQVRTKQQNTHASWCHSVYKPELASQKAAMTRNGDEISRYSRAMGNYYYAKDRGRPMSKPPDCPQSVQRSFGCLPT